MTKRKEYYSAEEAAEILGVTTRSIHNWIRSGRLKAEQEYIKGKGWGRDVYKLLHAEVMKEKKTVARCKWCKKVIKDAKHHRVRSYCDNRHKYLHRKALGLYDKPKT